MRYIHRINISIDQFSKFAIAILLFSMPLPMQFFNTALVVILALRFVLFKTTFKISNDVITWTAFGLISYFVLELIQIIYTDHKAIGFSILERKLSFIAIPLLFISLRDQIISIDLNNLLHIYVQFFLFIVLFLFTFALGRLLNTYISTGWFEENYFTIELPFILGMSHVYFALYAVFAIIIGLFLLMKNPNTKRPIKIQITIMMISTIIALICITAKASILVTIIILFYFMLLNKSNTYFIKTIFGLIFIVIIATATLINLSSNVKSRILNLFPLENSDLINDPKDYRTTRILPLRCSLTLLKDAPIWGYGQGDVQNLMNNCYFNNNFTVFNNHNPHNQYIQTYLGGGLLQLLVFLSLLATSLLSKGKSNLFLANSFSILFMLCSITESLLERNKGIILFCFGILLIQCLLSSQSLIKK